MPKNQSLRRGGLAVRVLGSLALLGGIAALFVLLVPQSKVEKKDRQANSESENSVSRKCEDELASLLEGLSPGRLGISSDRVTLVNRLNSWQADCRPSADSPKAGAEIEAAKSLLTGESLTRTLSETFLPEDASHIRNALLFRDVVTHLTEAKANNLDRYSTLFQFVCRNQMLVPEEILKDLPLTPYEALVLGMGSPEHRAWTFCELLRQMRTDVVIIRPQGEGVEKEWLIGVIDPTDGVLLFDPRLGMPIPPLKVGDEKPKLPAATLAQVLESDEPFRQLDLPENPYPLKSEHLKQVKIGVIGTSCSWAPRMARLQFLLPSKFTVELYDGLVESELRSPGLRQRVIDAGSKGSWSAENVSIWNFSEDQLIAFEATRGEGAEGSTLKVLLQVFQGPYVPIPTDKEGNYKMVPVDRSLHFVRVEQLSGNQTAAMKDYLPIRSAAKMAPSPANNLAAEYAALWTGVAQFETRKFHPAFNTLYRFFSTQATSTGLVRSGIEWSAECLVAEKQYAAAARLLNGAPPGLSQRRDALLIREWFRMAGLDPDKELAKKDAPAEAMPPEQKKPDGKMPEAGKPEEKKADDKKPEAMKAPEGAPPAEKAPEKMPAKMPEEKPAKDAADKPADKADSKPAGEMKAPEKPKVESPAPASDEVKDGEKPARPPIPEKPEKIEAKVEDKPADKPAENPSM
ncbi:hypothetical protein [Planctomicrobium sp. SH527]|uniref:hypothetical protein n=1 Tax=Planctomicrobium sp. SH527 TaxID=3448123 RepID=UPI003F5B785F